MFDVNVRLSYAMICFGKAAEVCSDVQRCHEFVTTNC
jgi:hypothetical protein